ncbi:MAG: ZIP family metal transporter [Lachnospiraceae bacterium]|nr:ZIP family metal transporter [Lachnospiraceae bacterium]
MQLVFLTALGIGGATVAGAIMGFLIPNCSQKLNDVLMGFAAGVMMAAAVVGLILPAIQGTGKRGIPIVGLGLLCGALILNLLDKVTPHLHHLSGVDSESHHNGNIDKVLLFVFAIGLHNLPEGLAAGVSFGGGNIGNAMSVALGIALQNIPEGMIIISPMLMAGMSKKRTFLIASCTGLVEVIGTFLGYAATSVAASILPFALSVAGGTMLYVVSDEMIPETHSHGNELAATYALMAGFFLMLVMDTCIG